MLKEKEIRKKILTRIEKMSTDKLDNVWKLLKSIENQSKNNADILSYAGCWKDLDQELFDDLTINLGEKRLQDRRP